MTYAVKADMVGRFGEQEIIDLTDRAEPRSNGIDNAVLAKALSDADSEINGYIGTRYLLPITTPPADIVRTACDIARYRLHDDKATEEVRQRYEDARSWLRDVAKGAVVLLDASGTPLPAPVEAIPGAALAPTKTIRFGSDFDATYDYDQG